MAHVFQINRSKGGVPKQAISFATVTRNGLEGDAHQNTHHHGGEERALCLYSLEKILALQMEGHPIFPGSVGENLTLWGVNWDQLQAGTILRFEGGLEVVLTKPVKPCQTIAASFRNGAIQRILHDQFPGWSRWYGKVLKEGVVRTGERLEVFR